MMNDEDRFELDLRAAMAPEAASQELRRRVLESATPRRKRAAGALPGWLAAFDPRSWRLMELGALAAAASLAIGVFAGASGFVPNGLVPGATTTTVASNDTNTTVDLVTIAYDSTGSSGDLQ